MDMDMDMETLPTYLSPNYLTLPYLTFHTTIIIDCYYPGLLLLDHSIPEQASFFVMMIRASAHELLSSDELLRHHLCHPYLCHALLYPILAMRRVVQPPFSAS